MTLQLDPSTERDQDTLEYAIRFPESEHRSQAEECCEIRSGNGPWRRLRLHDYDAIYNMPGLYEQLFAQRLQCVSPQRVVSVFSDVLSDWAAQASDLNVLELGAGNGMVGEELRALGVGRLVGTDILPEAAQAATRDRPEVYDDYLVADLTDADHPSFQDIANAEPNCLVTVAALGFGDIPPAAFRTAYNLVSTPGWIVFNIKETFLGGVDDTGFSRLIRRMTDEEYMQIQSYRRYGHRLSTSGQRLHYVAIVARKLKPLPASLLETAQ